MSLKNILIVVENIECSKKFYHDVFGLNVIKDFDKNIILTEGLVLQEKSLWEEQLNQKINIGNGTELFFEENNLDSFLIKLKENGKGTLLSEIYYNPFGKRSVMLKDPDGHLIEVAER